jgi:CRP/FNR family nitrogen fixation transcriptional regulator
VSESASARHSVKLSGVNGSGLGVFPATDGWAVGNASCTPPRVTDSRLIGNGRKIFSQGEAADYFYQVVSGQVRTYTMLDDGRRQIDGFYLAGDIFGIEAGASYRFSASSIGQVVVFAFRRRDLESLMGLDSKLSRVILSSLIDSLARKQDHLLLLGRRTAREKVEGFLLEIAKRTAKATSTGTMPLQRADIADYLGLSRETVCRVLSQLSRDTMTEFADNPRQ